MRAMDLGQAESFVGRPGRPHLVPVEAQPSRKRVRDAHIVIHNKDASDGRRLRKHGSLWTARADGSSRAKGHYPAARGRFHASVLYSARFRRLSRLMVVVMHFRRRFY